MLKKVEHVVPKRVRVLETTILSPLEQEFRTVLPIDEVEWAGCKTCVASDGVQDILIYVHLGNAGAIHRHRDEWCPATIREDADGTVRIDGEVTIMRLLESLVQIKAELVFGIVAIALGGRIDALPLCPEIVRCLDLFCVLCRRVFDLVDDMRFANPSQVWFHVLTYCSVVCQFR